MVKIIKQYGNLIMLAALAVIILAAVASDPFGHAMKRRQERAQIRNQIAIEQAETQKRIAVIQAEQEAEIIRIYQSLYTDDGHEIERREQP